MDKLLSLYHSIDRRKPTQVPQNEAQVSEKKRKRLEGVPLFNSIDALSSPSSVSSASSHISSTSGIVSVIFQGREGFANSVTHYYHFLFAVMVPLVEYYLKNKRSISGFKISTDIGPMKSLLLEIPLNITSIVGPNDTKTRTDATTFPGYVALPAYDIFVDGIYGEASTGTLEKRTVRDVLGFFKDTLPSYISCIPTVEIILIERTNNESYYRSIETVKKHQASGSSLRSIGNHKDLYTALSTKYGNRFSNITLERSSIYYQYHIFSHAKVIIAQHGAALSNILFMRPDLGSTVIELLPMDTRQLPQFREKARMHFENLSKHIGVNYVAIKQMHDHSDIDVTEVLTVLDKICG